MPRKSKSHKPKPHTRSAESRAAMSKAQRASWRKRKALSASHVDIVAAERTATIVAQELNGSLKSRIRDLVRKEIDAAIHAELEAQLGALS